MAADATGRDPGRVTSTGAPPSDRGTGGAADPPGRASSAARRGDPVPSAARRGDRAASTRHQLLVAAGRHFAAAGYHATALKGLLGGGTVTKGALYFHFPSKEALARALVDAMDESWSAVVESLRRRTADPLRLVVELTDVVIVRMADPIAAGAARIMRDRVLVSPTLADHTEQLKSDYVGFLQEAADQGLLRPGACPAWIAHEIVMTFAGRRTLVGSRGDTTLRAQMDDFWGGFLPLVATADWVAAWEASDPAARPLPDPAGLASLTPSVVAAAAGADRAGGRR